jgi:H+/Cl- antiporter ClcA/CBS domain-containing protein
MTVTAHSGARRTIFLAGLAAVLGVVGGAAAWVLIHLIAVITNLALLHRWGWNLPTLRGFHPDATLVIVAVLGGLVVSLLAKWAPVIRGHGIPEAMEAVLTRQSRIEPSAAVAKPTSAAVAIGTGGPFGAEGPIIVTGGAVGSLVGQVLTVTPSERKILLACGAAAGMAATFGTPLAAVVLAIELLLFEFSPRAFIPLAVSSAVAGGMHVALFGSGPIFTVPPHEYAGIENLPVVLLLGVACGLLAVLICKGLYLVEATFRRLPLADFWHPLVGAAVFACIGLAVPRALGVGYDVIDDVLADKLAVATLITLLVGKLVMWCVALGSGTSGGTLAPILLMSAAFGSLCGALLHEVIPGSGLSAGAMALIAMAATFGAATQAAFTSIVFAFELTRDYDAILPLMIGTVVACIVASLLLDHGLMTEKLARRGLRVPSFYEPDVLRTTTVRQAMTAPVATLPCDATVADVRRMLADSGHRALPLVDRVGRCVGIVGQDDLIRDGVLDENPALGVASTDVVTATVDAPLLTVVEDIVDEGVEHVPVVDGDGRVVGICTRTDVFRVRREHAEHERRQVGWRASRRNGHRAT